MIKNYKKRREKRKCQRKKGNGGDGVVINIKVLGINGAANNCDCVMSYEKSVRKA